MLKLHRLAVTIVGIIGIIVCLADKDGKLDEKLCNIFPEADGIVMTDEGNFLVKAECIGEERYTFHALSGTKSKIAGVFSTDFIRPNFTEEKKGTIPLSTQLEKAIDDIKRN